MYTILQGTTPTNRAALLTTLPSATVIEVTERTTVALDQLSHTSAHALLADAAAQQNIECHFFAERLRWQDFSIIACDMDSTLIAVECIDELAAYAGVSDKVVAITESAMRGELPFSESLNARVALLKNLPVSVLDAVLQQRLRYNPGAKELISAANRQGLHMMLISGGFTFFADAVAQELGIHQVVANSLEVVDGKLSGRVVGKQVDAEYKATVLQAAAKSLGVSTSRAITVGDGANDLPMMAISGLSVAYHGKPSVRLAALQKIDFLGLDAMLDWFVVEG